MPVTVRADGAIGAEELESTFSVTVAAPVTVVELSEAVSPAGAAPSVSVTGAVNPFAGSMASEYVVEPPAETVRAAGVALMAKSGTGGATGMT